MTVTMCKRQITLSCVEQKRSEYLLSRAFCDAIAIFLFDNCFIGARYRFPVIHVRFNPQGQDFPLFPLTLGPSLLSPKFVSSLLLLLAFGIYRAVAIDVTRAFPFTRNICAKFHYSEGLVGEAR